MDNKFIVNIIHRPEMVPEYAEKVTGHGKEEDIQEWDGICFLRTTPVS